jgi:hypothetical protein
VVWAKLLLATRLAVILAANSEVVLDIGTSRSDRVYASNVESAWTEC